MFNKLFKHIKPSSQKSTDRLSFILDKKDINSFALFANPKLNNVSVVIRFEKKNTDVTVRYEGETLDEIMDKIECDTLKE
jgi:hypothetical protein